MDRVSANYPTRHFPDPWGLHVDAAKRLVRVLIASAFRAGIPHVGDFGPTFRRGGYIRAVTEREVSKCPSINLCESRASVLE